MISVQDMQETINQIYENTNKPNTLAILGNISSITSSLKEFIGL